MLVTNEALQEHFEAIRAGDKEAFACVYHQLKTPVYTVIYRIVQSHGAAEDVMQELFLKLYQSPPTPSVINLRAWMFQVARNLAIDQLRKEKQHIPLEEVAGEFEAAGHEVDQELDLERALKKLEDNECQIVTLHLIAGLTFREIASLMGLSLPAVYRRYRKALIGVRNDLEGELR